MVVGTIPSHSLQDSLTQLARSFQAHEATTSVGQIAECLEKLPNSDRSALDRLFSLVYRNTVGDADGCVAHRQIHGADSDLIGTCKHRWPAYLLRCTNICPAGPWSTAATRSCGPIGLARKRTIANRKPSALCQTKEKCRQRIRYYQRITRDHFCKGL
jgi:hypothetical protein